MGARIQRGTTLEDAIGTGARHQAPCVSVYQFRRFSASPLSLIASLRPLVSLCVSLRLSASLCICVRLSASLCACLCISASVSVSLSLCVYLHLSASFCVSLFLDVLVYFCVPLGVALCRSVSLCAPCAPRSPRHDFLCPRHWSVSASVSVPFLRESTPRPMIMHVCQACPPANEPRSGPCVCTVRLGEGV